MADSRAWEPCQFGDDGFLVRPKVHDNFVYALSAQLEHRRLALHTHYRDGGDPGELTDVRFSGLVAHFFHDVADPSILLDIQRVPAGTVVEQWQDLFEGRKDYGWPPAFRFTEVADLPRKMAEQGVVGYLVMGSCGLDGFVLAVVADHRRRDEAAEFS